jgi:AhpD family alkylhydroperoxidase
MAGGLIAFVTNDSARRTLGKYFFKTIGSFNLCAASVESRRKRKMESRIDVAKVDPKAYHAMLALETYIHQSSLEKPLLELMKMRASQINGCAYCLDMHSKDARAAGETEQRLYELNAWRETPFYSERERAALAWTESLTLVSETHVPDEVFEEVKKHFSEAEIVALTMAVVAINSWNRIAVSLRAVPGTYQPQQHTAQAHASHQTA